MVLLDVVKGLGAVALLFGALVLCFFLMVGERRRPRRQTAR